MYPAAPSPYQYGYPESKTAPEGNDFRSDGENLDSVEEKVEENIEEKAEENENRQEPGEMSPQFFPGGPGFPGPGLPGGPGPGFPGGPGFAGPFMPNANQILRYIEVFEPEIIRTMRSFGMPLTTARQLTRRIIRTTLRFCR
jgi:hypothetical protein